MNEKFEKFTERARKVLSLSQEEAQRFNHNYIGTEHLLLGLIREGDGIAAKVLTELGVDLDKVRNAVEFIIGRGDRVVLGEVGLTPRSKKVIELAVDEARRLNHHYVGTEHLLLGLVREGEGIAAGVLESLGVNLQKVRSTTISILNQGGTGRSPRATPSRPRPSHSRGRFSDRGQRVLRLAIHEARERKQFAVGTGHVLLALLAERDGFAAWALGKVGIPLDTAIAAIERDLEEAQRALYHDIGAHGMLSEERKLHELAWPYLDEHVLRLIVLAADEAQQLAHPYIGPEHLLLGILAEDDGVGAQILAGLTPNLDQLREVGRQSPTHVFHIVEDRPSIGRLTLLCKDVDETATFYIRHLGAVATAPETSRGKQNLRLPGGGPTLALREAHPDAPIENGFVLDIWAGDLDRIMKVFEESGVASVSPLSENADGRYITVTDPDGRLVRIFDARKQADDQPDA